ncbi:hypothetical protein BU183_10440 [Enterococcus faecium]|nr:hypothetical protein BU183_10440 [Enterococcus faecium]
MRTIFRRKAEKMKWGFRWYGEKGDSIPLKYVRQIPGINGIIGTLLTKMPGDVWEISEIEELKASVESQGLELLGIESVAIHDAIKAGTEDTYERIACENITITNCTMVHGHGGVVLGSEMSGSIRNITISNCIFQETDRGIRLKSRRGRGGIVEDIRVSNIVMDNVMCPFILNLYYFCGPRGKEPYVWEKKAYPIDERTPAFRRIHFSNITARNVHASAGFIYGLAEQFIQEITFDNIDVSMAQDAVPGVPAMMTGIEEMSRQGFYIGFAGKVSFNQMSIENHEGPAFLLENTKEISIEKFQSNQSENMDELVVRKNFAYAVE